MTFWQVFLWFFDDIRLSHKILFSTLFKNVLLQILKEICVDFYDFWWNCVMVLIVIFWWNLLFFHNILPKFLFFHYYLTNFAFSKVLLEDLRVIFAIPWQNYFSVIYWQYLHIFMYISHYVNFLLFSANFW